MISNADTKVMKGKTVPSRDLTYTQVIVWAVAIGIAGGLVATAYYFLLEGSLHLVWHRLPEIMQVHLQQAINYRVINQA